jgi:hypothetical protein
MNDISFSGYDFYIILLAFGGIAILVSAICFIVRDLQIRQQRRTHEREILDGMTEKRPVNVATTNAGHFSE